MKIKIIINSNKNNNIQSRTLHVSEPAIESNFELPLKKVNKVIINIVKIKTDILKGFQLDPSYFFTKSKNFFSFLV